MAETSSAPSGGTGTGTGTALIHSHMYGLKADVTPAALFADETTVVQVCGHNVVLYNTETKRQRVIPGSESTKSITALALSNNKNLLAVAERGDHPSISIYDLKHNLRRKKHMVSTEAASAEIVCLAFSDQKTLLAQGGAPDWTLSLWTLDKGKIIASSNVSNAQNSPIRHVSFCPTDASIVCVTGESVIRFFRVQDGVFKSMNPNLNKRDPQIYPAHCWLGSSAEQRLVASNDAGELLLFENTELRYTIPAGEGDENVEAIASYSKGFICGCEGGIVRVFEQSDEGREPYKRSMSLDLDTSRSKISHLAVSPGEEFMLVVTEDNQMYSMQLSNLDIIKSEDTTFELLGTRLHAPNVSGQIAILGLDVCIRKPLVVTGGSDKSVRVWNFQDKSVDLMRVFEEDITSCAFHPSGLVILVGFTDKLRLMNLLMDDIRTFKEFSVKACNECVFSTGGHLFAAVSGNAVHLYDFYTFECLAQLRGHNQKVMSLAFCDNDRTLVSAGMDGSTIRWNVYEGRRTGEYTCRGVVSNSVVICPPNNGSMVVVAGSDKLVKTVEFAADGSSSVPHEMDAGIAVGHLCMTSTGATLFAACSEVGRTGCIRAYNYPLTGHYVEYQGHAGPIMRMRIAHDDSRLFTVGVDGALFIFDINEQAPSKKHSASIQGSKRSAEVPLAFAEEILVTKSNLEEKISLMNDLRAKVEELTLHNEYQLRLKDMSYAEKIKEVKQKFSEELEEDQQRYDTLMEEKEDMKLEYEYKIKNLDQKQKREVDEMDSNYQAKINAEVERYEQLVSERAQMNQEWDEKNEMLVDSHQNYISEMTENFENKLHEEEEARQLISEQKETLVKQFEKAKTDMEEDADIEVEELKRKYDSKLVSEKEATLRLKGENGIMRKKFHALQKDIEDQREEIKGLLEKQQQLYEKIKGLEKDITGHKKEISEREETIQDKEKRIYDLKKKNQELEKFKFVLDYKIKELKRQIEPRENEIADMAQQIKEMDQELEQYHKSNAALDLMIGELRLKMEGMQKEADQQKRQINLGDEWMARACAELQEVMPNIDSKKSLKSSVTRLYKKYVQEDLAAKAAGESDVQKEYNRQREYLEKSVESLKRKLAKDMELHSNENMRLMRESVTLTKEINELRRELRMAKMLRGQVVSQMEPQPPPSSAGSLRRKPQLSSEANEGNVSSTDAERELEMQQQHLSRLRSHIARLEDAIGGPLSSMKEVEVPAFDRSQYI